MLNVKKIMKQKGITRKDLAEKLDINPVSVSRLINGNPTLDTLKKIADALDVTVPELFAPQNTSDFTAFIDYKGEMKRFDSPEELKRFLDKV